MKRLSLNFNIGSMAIVFDWHHWLITILSAISGALMAYFSSQTPDSLIQAIGDWNVAKRLLAGAGVAILGALVALAKQTYVVSPAQTPPASPDAVQRGVSPSIPVSYAPPASKRVALWWVSPVVAMCVAIGVSGCTKAEAAIATNIENTVLADLAAGKTLPQIEADVAGLIICPGAANGSCKSAQAIVAIVNDTLDLLIGLGVIPPGVLPVAQSYHAQLTQQIAASRTP